MNDVKADENEGKNEVKSKGEVKDENVPVIELKKDDEVEDVNVMELMNKNRRGKRRREEEEDEIDVKRVETPKKKVKELIDKKTSGRRKRLSVAEIGQYYSIKHFFKPDNDKRGKED